MDDSKTTKRYLTPKSKDTPRWYTDIIQMAKVADYGPARGTMVIRPYGFSMWETTQREFDKLIKEFGVENAYFPLFIPMSLLKREKKHVEGFAPELAVVTHGGGEKLAEPLVVRPTSETIMYEMYAKWISSWKDLPIKINQWNNVVRWEKRTYFFLRTLEFLWQEGHTAHASEKEAEQMTLEALGAYQKIYDEVFAMPGIVGIKSDAEKFAGAKHTYAIEFLMPDGKALQGATSHNLGQNFSKVFKIAYQDKNGKNKFVWQTSWGLSTRSLGGLFLTHGDDNGLVLPPKIAPTKAVIIPILGKKDETILRYCQKLEATLTGAESAFPGKIETWDDPEKTYGWKINEAELKGIPLIISVGTREMADRTLSVKYRLEGLNGSLIRLTDASEKIEEMLKMVQGKMRERALEFLNKNTHDANTYEEFKKIMNKGRGLIRAFWCENPDCEKKIKEETKATSRVKPFGTRAKKGKCIYCGKPTSDIWYFDQAY